MIQDSRPLIRVVAGIVLNQEGDYLLSSRPEGKPYAGYWEFAGGKVEPSESELDALKREFEEELGIGIRHATPWLTKIHAYDHAHVHLRFFRVRPDEWSGELQAREGQKWSWQRAGDFSVSPMLPANGSLFAALSVPWTLQGDTRTGFYGENRMGEYRVVPFEMAEAEHANVLISESLLQKRGSLPTARSVWVLVENKQQWQRAQDADVIVWQIADDEGARAAAEVLAEGVSQPLVVYAVPSIAARYANQWLAAGAHTVVENRETEVA